VGAEYLGNTIARGSTDERGLRNEDARRLSFADGELKAVLSFDVFEHMFDYRAAFRECYRVLGHGGTLIFTVPFDPHSSNHIERAVESSTGEILHLMPPEYHGDPLSDGGILCYRHYGWKMLDELREVGFGDVFACVFHSEPMGYYTNQIIFICEKV
jgi:SAM-dependent methyltransferase